ncbi:hypothetical protein Tco_0236120 [Tanacetum coccineum]
MTLLSFSLDIGADFVVNDAGTCGTSSAHCWDTCTLVHVTRRVNIARPTSVSVTRLEFRDQSFFRSCLVPGLLRHFCSLSLVTWALRVPLYSAITSLKCVLTQEHLDAICAKYFVPEEVHPQLPSSDATMHERPTGKVRMYT